MKNTLYLLCTLAFIGCTDQPKKDTLESKQSQDIVSSHTPNSEEGSTSEVANPNVKTKILLPSEYRDWENENPANDLTKDWLELYHDGISYQLRKAEYSIQRGYSECSGDSTIIIQATEKTVLFLNHDHLTIGKVPSNAITKDQIWPNEEISFVYNDVTYTLRATGNYLSASDIKAEKGPDFFAEVSDYKLYISTDTNTETVFLEESSFNDTFVKLLFVGDIDADGKLDFLFESNRHYEEERVMLYLSSEASEKEVIQKAGEIAIGFDC